MTFDELIEKGMSYQEAKLKTTVFFVESTSTEYMYLWKENHIKYIWEEDSSGFARTIGYIDDQSTMPITVSFRFASLFGLRICFYEATSRFVDYTKVEDYIKNNYPVKYDNGSRWAMTDSMNFHHVTGYCEEFNLKTIGNSPNN